VKLHNQRLSIARSASSAGRMESGQFIGGGAMAKTSFRGCGPGGLRLDRRDPRQELTDASLDVVAIERGGWRDTSTDFAVTFAQDELRITSATLCSNRLHRKR